MLLKKLLFYVFMQKFLPVIRTIEKFGRMHCRVIVNPSEDIDIL